MTLVDDLMQFEREFWTRGSDFYLRNVHDECLVAFAQMAGVMDRERLAHTVAEGRRWSPPQVKVKGLLRPTEDFAILTYEAAATRSSGEPYSAIVSSGYLRQADGWRLAFHQQTPIEGT